MKLLVIHLSDFHLDKQHTPKRLPLVARAVQNLAMDTAAVAVIVSGDITFSGLVDEYSIAKTAFDDLIVQLRDRFPNAAVHLMAVPGNHDCDFTNPNAATRALVLRGLAGSQAAPLDVNTLCLCTKVQEHFFEFLNSIQTIAPEIMADNARYDYRIPVGTSYVLVSCFNTAFASANPEIPGTLVLPSNVLFQKRLEPPPLYTIAVFHHPYNWLTPETKRQFSEFIHTTSDLILTGHEHTTAYYKKETSSGMVSDYIEGAAFQETNASEKCGFNVMIVDLTIAQERILEFRWNSDHFAQLDINGGWRPYRRSRSRHDFALTEAMEERLEDSGAAFSHPAKTKLLLQDIFVPPAADELTFHQTASLINYKTVESRDLISTIAGRKHVLLVGRERSGKTTLAKVLFRHFYYQGFVPVLIEGDHIKSSTIKGEDLAKFSELIHERLLQDYQNPLLDKFEQLEPEKVVLIIDDLDHANINPRGRLKLLDQLSKRFRRVIVISDETLRFEEFTYGELGAKVLSTYTQLTLKEFGHVLRSALIDKWYDVNSEYVTQPDVLSQKVLLAERVVDEVIQKSYLPFYPFFILTMLQGADTGHPIDNSAASYGYLFEVLITEKLAKTGTSFSLDIKLGYLVELAFYMFSRNQRELSEADFQLFHAHYTSDYSPVDEERLIKVFEQVGMLEIYDRHYRFKYPCFYYYFVAQYFARNLEDPKIRQSVIDLCDEFQKEEHAHIWLFLAHQSRSNFLLETIVQHARRFFPDIKTPAFGDDVDFLQQLFDKVPELVLINKTPEEIRRERREQLDRQSKLLPASGNSEAMKTAKEEESETLKLVSDLRAALRTLEVLGQIVKNFAGSLKKGTRYDLVTECYELGLRVEGAILKIWQQAGEQFVREVLDIVLLKETHIETREELETLVKGLVFFFCETTATAMVMRISQAVGVKDLASTYREILQKNPVNSYKLINLSVHLDNLGFPTGDVYDLNETFKSNIFCQRVLSRLVIHHFYLFTTSEQVKQQICTKLGIKMRELRGIDVKTETQKRLPERSDTLG
jgi:Calcineurin-like phosphoesterase